MDVLIVAEPAAFAMRSVSTLFGETVVQHSPPTVCLVSTLGATEHTVGIPKQKTKHIIPKSKNRAILVYRLASYLSSNY